MQVIQVVVVRKSGRRSRDIAVCLLVDGVLTSARGATYGRPSGGGERGQTNRGQHYYSRRATDAEVKSLVDAGLIDPQNVAIEDRDHEHGGRRRSPHKLPRPLLQQRARA